MNGFMRGISGLAAAAVLVLGMSGPAAAESTPTGPFGGNITGSVGLFSDYSYRGVSQTTRDPAIQGSLEYAFPKLNDWAELYIGVWGSNVRFSDAHIEIDITPGVRGSFGALSYNLNVIYYWYPGTRGSQDFNFIEPGLSLTYDFEVLAVTGGVRWSPDFFAGSGDGLYLYGEVAVPLAFIPLEKAKIVGHIGKQWIENNARFGSPDYTEWFVAFGFSAFTLDFSVGYYDTSLSRAQCAGTHNCEGRVIGSVSRAF